MAFDFTKIYDTWCLKSKISALSPKMLNLRVWRVKYGHPTWDHCTIELPRWYIELKKKEKKQMNFDTSWSRHGFKGSQMKPAHFAAHVWFCYFFGRKYSFFVSIEAKQGTCFFPMALVSRELPTLLMDTFLLTRVSSSVNSREFPYFRSSSHRSWTYQEPFMVSRWE